MGKEYRLETTLEMGSWLTKFALIAILIFLAAYALSFRCYPQEDLASKLSIAKFTSIEIGWPTPANPLMTYSRRGQNCSSYEHYFNAVDEKGKPVRGVISRMGVWNNKVDGGLYAIKIGNDYIFIENGAIKNNNILNKFYGSKKQNDSK